MIEDEVGDGLSPDPGGYDPYSVQTFPVAAGQFDNAGIDFMVDGVPVRYVFADEEFLEVSTSQVPPGLGWLRVPPPAPYNVQRDSLNGWADSLDARADRYETMATSANQARRNAARGGDDRADGENGVSAMVVVLLLIALELRRRVREAREEAETLPPG